MPAYSKMVENFVTPGNNYRGKPFWAWNDKLEPKELRRQIKIMQQMGFGGFYMHSRIGLATPYLSPEWFDCIKVCVEEAKSSNLEAWLYDEDRWPSGSAGGLATCDKKYRCRYLLNETTSASDKLSNDPEVLRTFAAKFQESRILSYEAYDCSRTYSSEYQFIVIRAKIAPPTPWHNGGTYLDTLNPEAVRNFIDITYEAYKKNVGEEFGKTIPGVFTDEPCYGFGLAEESLLLPWTERLTDIFHERYGYDLCAHLPELLYDVNDENCLRTRYHYVRLITELFIESYMKQIYNWCEENHLQLTGHFSQEDTLIHQTIRNGSAMAGYEYLHIPGIDYLTETRRTYATMKQLSSVARQLNRKFRLTETYGCTGWDFPLSGHKTIGDLQFVLGVNSICLHHFWYRMEGEAKRDYPASIGYQSPWWREYHVIADYFSRLSTVFANAEEQRDILVINPVESMWTQIKLGWFNFPGSQFLDNARVELEDNLLNAHLDFDYGDETLIAKHGGVESNTSGKPAFRIGHAVYRMVIVPTSLTLRQTTLALLEKFHRLGGKVIFAGMVPELIEGEKSTQLKALTESCQCVSIEALPAQAECCRTVSITNLAGQEIPGILYLLLQTKGSQILFICNTGYSPKQQSKSSFYYGVPIAQRQTEHAQVIIRGFGQCDGIPEQWDPFSGKRYMPKAEREKKYWRIETALMPQETRLFVVPTAVSGEQLPKLPVEQIVNRTVLDGSWNITLNEPNVVVLDTPEYAIGDGSWMPRLYILRIDRIIREKAGMTARSPAMTQPWARSRSSVTLPLALRYRLQINAMPPEPFLLALEQQDKFTFTVNGKPGHLSDSGLNWVDKSLAVLEIPRELLVIGENELILRTAYDDDSSLESIFLLGDFGVELKNRDEIITEAPRMLIPGDWCVQRLPFYSGAVSYHSTIWLPKLKPMEKLFLRLDKYDGTLAKILINGQSIGHLIQEPLEIELPDYKHKQEVELEIQIFGSRRNSHGPLHNSDKQNYVSSHSFSPDLFHFDQDYLLVPSGLRVSPELLIKKTLEVKL
jgi:hypothetical protein